MVRRCCDADGNKAGKRARPRRLFVGLRVLAFKNRTKVQNKIDGRCTAYTFLSPIFAPRDFEQYLEQLGGNPVEIDGVDREVIGLECHCLGSPIRREEAISLLVKNEEADS